MKIYIASKISIPEANRTLPRWDSLADHGHTFTVGENDIPAERPDVVICMSVSVMEHTERVLAAYPGVPLFVLHWDAYEWVWTNPRPGEYDYSRYGQLLKRAAEVWVPSRCTGLRARQWWGIENWKLILSCCPYWEHPVRDEGYALCTLREIPDPRWDWFERACEELSIPYRMTRHTESYADYQQAVAGCRFLVSHLYELSTGGLSLMEGYFLGKPVLLSNSPWHGGRDYFESRAHYFQHDSYEAFKGMLLALHNYQVVESRSDHRQYILDNFTDELMVSRMLERMHICGIGG